MEPIKLNNTVALAIKALGHLSWMAAFILLYLTLDDYSRNTILLFYAIGCIVNCVFMFGFAYVVEACSIYISKNQEKKRLTWKVEKKEEKTE